MRKLIKIIMLTLFSGMVSGLAFTAYADNGADGIITKHHISNVIIFGDSLSDTGAPPSEVPDLYHERSNNFWIKSIGLQSDGVISGAPITNVDPESPHLTRAIWPNYLMQDLFQSFVNQRIYPSHYARHFHFNLNLYNVDYAYASAETGQHYLDDMLGKYYPPYDDQICDQPGKNTNAQGDAHYCVPGVEQQVMIYLNDLNRLGEKPSPQTLYIIWGGGNDMFNNIAKLLYSKKNDVVGQNLKIAKKILEATLSVHQSSRSIQHLALSTPIRNTKTAVVNLIKHGVSPQQIFVINIPDLSKTPAAKAFSKGNKLILALFSGLSDLYDINLHLLLSFDLHHLKYNIPSSHVLSSKRLMNSIIKKSKKSHEGQFTNVTDACVSISGTHELQKIPFCKGFLFFNAKHPTTYTHKLLADTFYQWIEQA